MLRANLTLSENEVVRFEENSQRYPYQTSVGYQAWINRGLIAEGLFKDEEEIANSPRQTFSNDVRPGDIKYRDVNGDGMVNGDDYVPLKNSQDPGLNYGFATEFNWKNWNFNVFFEGMGRVSYFYGGTGYFPFNGENTGNVLQMVGRQEKPLDSGILLGRSGNREPQCSLSTFNIRI